MATPSLSFSLSQKSFIPTIVPRFTQKCNMPTLRKPSTHHPHTVSNGHDVDLHRCHYDLDQDSSYAKYKYIENIETVRTKFTKVNGVEEMVLVDSLNRLCIDHHFDQEISFTLSSLNENLSKSFSKERSRDLFGVSLSFRLLRHAGYNISSDVFVRFMDKGGEFKPSIKEDIKGLLSLHEASYLNTGENILNNANTFSAKQLKSAITNLEPNLANLVKDTLVHPYHASLHQYKARQHLKYLQNAGNCGLLEDIAEAEFKFNQALYRKELAKVTRWWKTLGLTKELPFARDQVLYWYILSITAIPGRKYSKQRIEITKLISLIHTFDDVFDNHGALEDLLLFTRVFDKWDYELASLLPNHMKICFLAISNYTNEVSEMCSKEYGWNPIDHLRKSWTRICNASLEEFRWLKSKQFPTAEEYLKNGIASISVHAMLLHLFVLLGNATTEESMRLVDENSPLIFCPSKIVRLWDDFGTSPNETGEGLDGSYTELYEKENPHLAIEDVTKHVRHLISTEWEQLNKECLSLDRSEFQPHFIQAAVNFARLITFNYSFSGEAVPIFNNYAGALLHGNFN